MNAKTLLCKLTINFLLLIAINQPIYANNQMQLASSNEFSPENTETSNKYIDLSLESLLQVEIYTTTASKIKENIDKSIATVTVINQQQISEMGARNLLDVLKVVPGFGITQGRFGARQIEVRGVKTDFSERVLLMLNGHPLDHYLLIASGVFNYDDLPVGSIKRIEIVRGPGSALYGANAFLSVINIITQNGKDLDGFEASAAYGSFDTQQYRASWGKQFDNSAEAALHFNYTDTKGIDSPLFTDSSRSTIGTSRLTEERYDFEWQLGYQDFKFEGRYINKKYGTFFGITNVLSNDQSEQNYENYFVKLSRQWKINDSFTIDTQVFHDALDYDVTWNIAPNTFIFPRFQESRTGGEIQANYTFSETQTLIAGFSYAEEEHGDLRDSFGTLSSSVPTPHTSAEYDRSRWGIYLQDVWDPFENLRLTLGVRYDEFSDFGETWNPRVGFNWEFIKNYSLKFSYGTAFRSPSIGELTLRNNPSLLGNQSLSPEEAETFEGGIIAHPIAGLTTQATYYHTNISKVITPVGISPPLEYENSGSIVSQGVELEMRYDFSGDFQGSYLSANSVWQQSKQSGRQLADVPRYRTNVIANWAIDNTWSSFAHVLINSSTLRNQGDTRADVSGYAVVDLGLLGKNLFNETVDISFNVYNLFDKRYDDPAPQDLDFTGDFQAAGISFFGKIDVHF